MVTFWIPERFEGGIWLMFDDGARLRPCVVFGINEPADLCVNLK